MLIAALEKLFQSIEYAHYPIKEEMDRMENLKEETTCHIEALRSLDFGGTLNNINGGKSWSSIFFI